MGLKCNTLHLALSTDCYTCRFPGKKCNKKSLAGRQKRPPGEGVFSDKGVRFRVSSSHNFSLAFAASLI